MKRKEEAYFRWERDVFEGQEMLMEAIVCCLKPPTAQKSNSFLISQKPKWGLFIYSGEKENKLEKGGRRKRWRANGEFYKEERNFSQTHVTLFCPQPINHFTVFLFFLKENFGKFAVCELP